MLALRAELAGHARTAYRKEALYAAIALIWTVASPGAVLAQENAQGRVSEVVLKSFTGPPRGSYPAAGLSRDSAGNLYGTTSLGGAVGQGVVFKLDTKGRQTVLHDFTGGSDGGSPLYCGVTRDSTGNLYGATQSGGSNRQGVVYKLDSTGNETVLYAFTGGSDGGQPFGGVVLDTAGNLYGTTSFGGSAGHGVVYRLDPSGNETVLHNFTGGSDGSFPLATVILDKAGNLYGITNSGGSAGYGVVYKLDPSGNETVLYTFTGGSDGGYPSASLTLDPAGNLFGTTASGGSAGSGVVYKVDSNGNETVLHSFTGGSDGEEPFAGVILDSSGNLYGTTLAGGAAHSGVVYKLDSTGSETVLYNFTGGSDGGSPHAGVVLDSAGTLYGTTYQGGTGAIGTVFSLAPGGTETPLYAFPDGTGGWVPYSGVTLDAAGNIYGTTVQGGSAGYGLLYKLSARGVETVLHTFSGGADGRYPYAGVVLDSNGNLYGTTYQGGSYGYGVVYRLDPGGNETVLHSFTLGLDGGWPYAGVTLDSAGNLYGTTSSGGVFPPYLGVVYKLDPSGNVTVLHSFTGGPDGEEPFGGVILDSAGNLYGTTSQGGSYVSGVVYKLDPSGNETILHNFSWSDGGNPTACVVQDSAGNLYGTTSEGGSYGRGVVYKLDLSGNETVLHTFTGGSDGSYPFGGVVLDSAGNLYGTTASGGSVGDGVVYRLDPSGNETVLYSFAGGSDGGAPDYGTVFLDSAGALFGTTTVGGSGMGGVVYEIKGAVPKK